MRLKLLVAALFAAAYSTVSLVRHWTFGSSGYDLGIFDQVVWHLSRFEAPASSIHGVSNFFGDHFSPIWILVAPLYWLHASPSTLLALQGVLIASSIIPVWVFIERRLPKREAALLTVAYGLFWGLQRGAQFDVHELMFTPVLIAWMVLEIDNGRARYIWPAMLLCFVKEDQIPVVAAAAAFAAWRLSGRARALSIGVAAAALAWFVIVVKVVIPALSDRDVYAVGSAFDRVTSSPASFIPTILTATKLNTLLMWLLPFLLLPLLSPYALLLVPLVLERFLSSSPNHWGTSFHYSLPLAPILATSTGDGLARLKVRLVGLRMVRVDIVGLWIAGLCVLLSALLPGRQPIWKLISPRFYSAPSFAGAAREALALIPGGASVVAQDGIVPHLSERDRIYTLRAEEPPVAPDFVIAAPEHFSPWPLADADAIRAGVDRYLALGYVRRFERDGWVVLSKDP